MSSRESATAEPGQHQRGAHLGRVEVAQRPATGRAAVLVAVERQVAGRRDHPDRRRPRARPRRRPGSAAPRACAGPSAPRGSSSRVEHEDARDGAVPTEVGDERAGEQRPVRGVGEVRQVDADDEPDRAARRTQAHGDGAVRAGGTRAGEGRARGSPGVRSPGAWWSPWRQPTRPAGAAPAAPDADLCTRAAAAGACGRLDAARGRLRLSRCPVLRPCPARARSAVARRRASRSPSAPAPPACTTSGPGAAPPPAAPPPLATPDARPHRDAAARGPTAPHSAVGEVVDGFPADLVPVPDGAEVLRLVGRSRSTAPTSPRSASTCARTRTPPGCSPPSARRSSRPGSPRAPRPPPSRAWRRSPPSPAATAPSCSSSASSTATTSAPSRSAGGSARPRRRLPGVSHSDPALVDVEDVRTRIDAVLTSHVAQLRTVLAAASDDADRARRRGRADAVRRQAAARRVLLLVLARARRRARHARGRRGAPGRRRARAVPGGRALPRRRHGRLRHPARLPRRPPGVRRSCTPSTA